MHRLCDLVRKGEKTMAKQKEEKTNVMRVLDQKKIPYKPHTYPHGGDRGPRRGDGSPALGRTRRRCTRPW